MPKPGNQKVLFLVQDQQAAAELAGGLRAAGHLVAVVERPTGAVAVVLREQPTMVIIEADRAHLDAAELTRQLKRNPQLSALPVLLLATHLPAGLARLKAVSCGAQGALPSGRSAAELVGLIADYLVLRRPLFPNDEAARRTILQQQSILDTAPEGAFDELVKVVAQVCETPIALLSLVDADRQWFKARFGLTAAETHRDLAFCAYTIHSPEPLEISDAQNDLRFTANELVTGDPHIRFYAGAPLLVEEGVAVGTLCVIDRVPRVLTPKQRAILVSLSRVAARLLDLRRQIP